MRKSWLAAIAAWSVVADLPGGSVAKTAPVKIVSLMELSGAGATAGTNFSNGVKLAVKEINAAGGILGRKLDLQTFDTQSNPGVAKALAQKAVDLGAFAVMGPVFSGSVIVNMNETKRAEIPNFMGGEAANLTQQGNPYVFRGITVAIPSKSTIAAMVDRLTRAAEAPRSVNLVRLEADGALLGDTVDGAGFVRGLVLHGHSLQGASASLAAAARPLLRRSPTRGSSGFISQRRSMARRRGLGAPGDVLFQAARRDRRDAACRRLRHQCNALRPPTRRSPAVRSRASPGRSFATLS
jgi:hypothetical protein